MIEKDIIIIGAGLTGLTTAYNLHKLSADFCVLEQKNRVGGVIETVKENGFIYEKGPNTGVLGTIEAVELLNDLGEFCTLNIADERAKKRYILKKGKWESLPSGIMGGITTPLFTLKDKFRLLGEPFRKRGNNPHETLANLVKRRMGQSYLDYAVDPFILGIYSGDPAYLVPKYALPKLYNLEQNYGSFIGGAFKKSFQKKSEQDKRVTRKIFSTENGLSSFTGALYRQSNPENFKLGVKNIEVEYQNNKFLVKTQQNGNAVSYVCNKLITTVGAYALPDILPFVSSDEMSKISNLRYARLIGANIGFHNWKGMNLEAFGGLIPHRENHKVLGYLFLSSFLKNRAPENGALLTCFVGGMRSDYLFDLSEDEIKNIIAQETSDLFGLSDFKPELFKITKHHKAIPQYGADCGERFEAVERVQSQFPGLVLGGNLRNGIGVADRIKQGVMLAKDAVGK